MSSPTTPPSAEEIVATPAVDGDLNAEMRRAAKPFSRATLVLAGLVVLAVAFGGGAWTHAAFGSSSSSTPTRTAGGTQAGPQAGQQAGGFRGGRGTTGTVDRVDGTTVYVKTAQGTEVKVSTSDSTTVGVTQQAKLSDLKPGSTVVVQGQAGEDGTVTAQAITQEAAR
ncbi:hypothetical protein [Amycolatopsis sp. SID8362]|uniref:hypothetical protein n=1 Tax=Amycolatopsis sp. SID8362 TaxID=2690346 RepID=UPI00136BBA82|nr:hypothetical protein [Amycolatopsis sp. SID8362]NBH04340.1 hypothetical protein [Amycolatopsis sp. SID8362]NED41039.1 hypothetical protein [Amycolatopsis sp. SID8362]